MVYINKFTSIHSPIDDFCSHTHEKSLIQEAYIITFLFLGDYYWTILSEVNFHRKSCKVRVVEFRGHMIELLGMLQFDRRKMHGF